MKQVDKIYGHVGPMFSGKSTELDLHLHNQEITGQRVALFRPNIDTRPQGNRSHDDISLFKGPVHYVRDSLELRSIAIATYNVIGIDEVQFFDQELVAKLYQLFIGGARITFVGLDYDFQGEPFATTMRLLVCPEVKVFKRKAVCMICGSGATRTVRLDTAGGVLTSGQQTVVGKEMYRPVCFLCFTRAIGGRLEGQELTLLRRKI